MFREEVAILIGDHQAGLWSVHGLPLRPGTADEVEADWAGALDREEQYGDVLGFFHTHPADAGVEPSPRDRRTMQAWVLAFGKPLLCVIASGEAISATIFQHAEDAGQCCDRIEHVDHTTFRVWDSAEPKEALAPSS